MVRAILQKGQTKHGLVLPAEAQKKVNEANDRSTLEKWLGDKAPGSPNIVRQPASPSAAVLISAPRTAPNTHDSLQQNVADRDSDATSPDLGQSAVLAQQQNVADRDPDATLPDLGQSAVLAQVDAHEANAKGELNTPDALQLMEGVGEVLEQHLYEAGYTTYEDIVASDKSELAEKVHGVSDESAKGIIKQAKKYTKLKAKGKL